MRFSYIKKEVYLTWNDIEMTLVSSYIYATLKLWGLYSYVPSFMKPLLMVAYEGLLEIAHYDFC